MVTPIMASVDLQHWLNDYDHAVSHNVVAFNAASILAGMSAEEVAAIEDFDDSADRVYLAAVQQGLVKDHKGPFCVRIREAIDSALGRDSDIFTRMAAEGAGSIIQIDAGAARITQGASAS